MDLPASYDVADLLKPVRDALTYDGKLVRPAVLRPKVR